MLTQTELIIGSYEWFESLTSVRKRDMILSNEYILMYNYMVRGKRIMNLESIVKVERIKLFHKHTEKMSTNLSAAKLFHH